jgi:hypothetical protein
VTGLAVHLAFKKLGWSRLEAAEHLGLNEKTIRRWIGSGCPPHADRVFKHLLAGEISPQRAKAMLQSDFERRVA